ncbi:MAG: DNA-3-methyladenine glycosylase 2 family protein [Sphingomonadaceae bacterium]|uniref:DNA-3-methyladenine glycosylase family protein n=1 Tax=Thermaurantiacus sp. TaxID=2820283 RepID=UPI00298EE7D5|nr:DNA-3-methyladenine glycosylase 2 family protein [Thermaurantiacus sp.]MCS6986216.1 DNA-3-methyladenine glycosylase 2 family protein [Sphingomonadaceae bacterium]MDW8415873.1 DNA-3-methyladenine glycosylase 2 family protein [Thermaurantiacus sp.]
MALTAERIGEGIAWLAACDPRLAEVVRRVGPPPPRPRPRGLEGLLRAIVTQQISARAAEGIWKRLRERADPSDPEALLALGPEGLRQVGFSRAKAAYALGLAAQVADGRIRLEALPVDDEAAIALLMSIKGLGRWSAEIYLLFAEGRPDVLPAGDLALRVEAARILDARERLSERALRAHAERWRPYRGVAAFLLWHARSAQPQAG